MWKMDWRVWGGVGRSWGLSNRDQLGRSSFSAFWAGSSHRPPFHILLSGPISSSYFWDFLRVGCRLLNSPVACNSSSGHGRCPGEFWPLLAASGLSDLHISNMDTTFPSVPWPVWARLSCDSRKRGLQHVRGDDNPDHQVLQDLVCPVLRTLPHVYLFL